MAKEQALINEFVELKQVNEIEDAKRLYDLIKPVTTFDSWYKARLLTAWDIYNEKIKTRSK